MRISTSPQISTRTAPELRRINRPFQSNIERFRPDLLPLLGDVDGHASLLSNRALRETVGWEHRTAWRDSG